MKQTSKLKMRRARFIFIMVLPAILFPMIFTYYPMIKGSLMAFQSYNLMNVKNIKWVGLENFSKLFAHNTSNTFYSTMLNTVKWVASKNTALYSCIIANIWYGIPFFTIMITAALRGVSEDLYEAADVDGASPYQKFTNITVPCIRSVLLLTVLLRVIWIFNFPDLIYSMTQGGPAGSSNIITSYMMQLVQSLDYGLASAVGVLCILFLIVFAAIYLVAAKYTDEEA